MYKPRFSVGAQFREVADTRSVGSILLGTVSNPGSFREQLLALTTGESLELIADNPLCAKGNRGL